jgi:hypothetical protein
MGSNRDVATFGDLLIVRDTEFGHQHVARLLASLREGLQIDPKSAPTKTGATTAQKSKQPSRSVRRDVEDADPFGSDARPSAENVEEEVEHEAEE